MTDTKLTTDELCAKANDLAAALNNAPACRNVGDGAYTNSCVRLESQRRPTPQERREKGWEVRPFHGYDHRRLCDACAAYWFASMAALCLQDVRMREKIAQAEEERAT